MRRIIVLLLLQSCLITFGQERLEIKNLGFSINVPENWNTFPDSEILKNLEKFDFTDEQIINFIKSQNQSVTLGLFTKYDSKNYAGIIPTIKIVMRENPTKSIKDFLSYVKRINEGVKNQLNDFVVVNKPMVQSISGNEVVNSSYRFKLKKGDSNYVIKANTYYIQRGSYFITINFIEELDKENNDLIFDELARSIKLYKN